MIRRNPIRKAAFVASAVAVSLSLALAGCSSGPAASDDSGPIKIGFSLPLAASIGGIGKPAQAGAELAVAEINDAGGIDGRQLDVSFEDNACNATDGQSSFEKLIEDGNIALIGGLCSDATLPALSVVERAEVPLLVDIASNPSITENTGPDGNDWAFRWSGSDSDLANATVDFLDSLGTIKTIAIVADNQAVGQGNTEAYKATAAKAGIEVLSADAVNLSSPDFSSIVARVAAEKPDAVVVAMGAAPTVSSFYQAYAASSLKETPLTGQIDMTQAPVADGTLHGYNATYYSSSVKTDGNTAFLEKWEAAGNAVADAYVGWDGYQSILVMADALTKADSITSADVQKALSALDFGPMVLDGNISFDDRNQAHPNLIVEEFTDGVTTPNVFEQKVG